MFLTKLSDGSDCHKRGLFYRITVHSCRDRRKCDCPDPMLHCSLQGIPIRIFKKLFFPFPFAMPDMSYRMDDIFTWQMIGSGNLCFFCPAAMQRPALIQKFRTGSTVNGTVYAPPPSRLLFAAFTIASKSFTFIISPKTVCIRYPIPISPSRKDGLFHAAQSAPASLSA